MNLETFELENLINALPQNRPLYKDSGCWAVRTDDMENEYMSQRHNETFKQFLIRYLEWVLEYEKDNEEEILWNLTMPV
jgi:tRNA(His) 5'-end guanylyltransferase